MIYALTCALVLLFLLYVWSNFVVRNVMCPLCDAHLDKADRLFGPVHVCAHLRVKEQDDAHL